MGKKPGLWLARVLTLELFQSRGNGLPLFSFAQLFYIDKKGRMVLLHSFIKKSQKTPADDLELARNNKSNH
jgi:hypothetical protein